MSVWATVAGDYFFAAEVSPVAGSSFLAEAVVVFLLSVGLVVSLAGVLTGVPAADGAGFATGFAAAGGALADGEPAAALAAGGGAFAAGGGAMATALS